MNWDAIGAIGEIIGAGAVVATLGYLAVQIRQNTKVARSATRQSIAEMTINLNADLVEDRTMAQTLANDLQGETLEIADRIRLLSRSYRAMRNWENIHCQFLSGMLSADEWRGFRLNLKATMEWRSMQEYWKNEHQFYSEAFQSEVSDIQREVESGSDNLSHNYILEEPRSD